MLDQIPLAQLWQDKSQTNCVEVCRVMVSLKDKCEGTPMLKTSIGAAAEADPDF